MRATGIVRRFDELGRIYIPKEIRIKLFGTKCTDGEPMEIFMDKDDIIIRKFEENKDDVCEWKDNYSNNQYSYLTSCDKIFEFDSDYNFCPYCGKKIKEVERMKLTNEICISFLLGSGWLYNHDKEITISERNKAIDDFAEKLNAKCDGMIKDKWNSNVAPVSWAEAYADFKDDIDEISEQLKAGGNIELPEHSKSQSD